jgi:hypothetical protein
LAVVLGLSAGQAPANEQTIAFSGATLMDGTGAMPIEDAVLVVGGGRIATLAGRPMSRFPRTPSASTCRVAGSSLA